MSDLKELINEAKSFIRFIGNYELADALERELAKPEKVPLSNGFMKTLYRTNFSTIDRIKVQEVTDKTVLLQSGDREKRHTTTHAWFDTFEEAKQDLVRVKLRNIESANSRLQAYQRSLNSMTATLDRMAWDLYCASEFNRVACWEDLPEAKKQSYREKVYFNEPR